MNLTVNPNQPPIYSPLEVTIDEEESASSQTARKIFNVYSRLLELRGGYSDKIVELKAHKKEIKKSWSVYFYYKDEGVIQSRSNSVFGALAGGFAGASLVFGGLALNNAAMSIGGATVISATFCTAATLLCYPPACIKEQLNAYEDVGREIYNVTNKAGNISHCIKLTHIFAEINEEWSKYKKSPSSENRKQLFEKVNNIMFFNRDAIMKLDEGKFKSLSLVFLMEKVCSIHSDSELAKSWNQLKPTPALWGGEKDREVWNLVGLPHQPSESYVQFHQSQNAAYADPEGWCDWLNGKIQEHVNSKHFCQCLKES